MVTSQVNCYPFLNLKRREFDVRREFRQRLSTALHGSYLRNAFQEGSADVVAYMPACSSG
jgi:hypothetical protein